MLKLFSFSSLLAAIALTLAACQSDGTSHAATTAASEKSVLRLNIVQNPGSLDPRQVRDLSDHTIAKMLGEGLTRLSPDHQPQPALAKAIEISPDGLTYTFTLRDSVWSDGTPVTASDFTASWLSTLSPKYASPNTSFFYPIRGAAAAKGGDLPLSDVSIKAPDTHTLIVELESPTPYFLELVSLPMFFPIPTHLEEAGVAWSGDTSPKHVSNGPFRLVKWGFDDTLEVVRNEHYWDASSVQIDGIAMIMVPDATTELSLFRCGDLDWAGSPLSSLPADAIPALQARGELHAIPYAGTFWFKCNTARPPLNHVKVRKALAYAINRKLLVDSILVGQRVAATSALPPTMALHDTPYFHDGDTILAHTLFEEALQEMGDTRETLPPITLLFRAGDLSSKIAQAVQQQWKLALGITATLEAVEWKIMGDRMAHGDYSIGGKTWIADFNDPINFLGLYLYKDDLVKGGRNETGWEDADYTELLLAAGKVTDASDRNKLLHAAEGILVDQMPVIPVFHPTYTFVKRDTVQGVYISPIGTVDFKWTTKSGKRSPNAVNLRK